MAANDEEGPIEFVVVMNEEQQYSIWPQCRSVPVGWRSAGVAGTKEECLEYIERVWTDLRPLSLRDAMAKQIE
ncbi:MAG: MbtH family NRPS accessory protein [Steroidobacteraceae bacterium]